jgi:hypothetical protein
MKLYQCFQMLFLVGPNYVFRCCDERILKDDITYKTVTIIGNCLTKELNERV